MSQFKFSLAFTLIQACVGEAPLPGRSCLSDDDLGPLCLHLSRDGKKLAMAGGTQKGGDWKIFDLAKGECSINGMNGNERCTGAWGVRLSDDDSLVAVGGNARSLFLIDAKSGNPYWNLTGEGHRGVIKDLVFTPDNKYLISSASDMTIRVWDIKAKRAHAVFRFESTNPRAKMWTPEAAETAKHVYNIQGKYVFLGRIAITPDGTTLAVAGNLDGEVPFIDLATSKIVKTITMKRKYASCLQFTPDGKWLVGGGAPPNGVVEIWDIGKNELVATFGKHDASITHIAISPDKKTVLTGGTEDGFRVWDLATGKQKFSYFTRDDPRLPRAKVYGDGSKNIQKEVRSAGVAFLPDGKSFLIAPHWWNTEIYFHDTATGELVDFREAVKGLPAAKK